MWNPFKKHKELDYLEGGLATKMNFSLESPAEELLVMDENPAISLEQAENEAWSIKLRQVVRVIVLALSFLVPIFTIPLTAPGDVLILNKQILIYGLVLISLILWLVMIVRQGGVRFKTSGFEWGILGFLTSVLLASIFSDQVYQSFLSSGGFVTTASLAVLSFIILNFFEKEELGRVMNYFMAGSFLAVLAGVLALYGVPVFKIPSLLFYKNLVFSPQFNTVGSVNSLGALASLLLVMISASFFGSFDSQASNSTENNKFLSWLMLAVKIGGVIFSAALLLILNWWVFYVVVAVSMIGLLLGPVFLKKNFGHYLKPKAVNLFGPLVIIALALLFIFSSQYLPFDFPGRQNLPVEISISQKGSLEVVKGLFSEKAPFGIGPGNFSLAFDKYKPAGVNNSAFWNTRFGNAASELWNLVAQTGLVGSGAFIFFIFSIFYFPLKTKGLNQERNKNSLQIISVFLGALALFLLYPFNIVLNFAFWFFIGLWSLAVGSDSAEKRIVVRVDDVSLRSVLSSLGFVLVLVFGLLGGYLMFQKYEGELYFSKAARINLASAKEIDQAIGLIGKSFQANQNDNRYLNSLAELILRKINIEVNNKKDKPEEVTARVENLIRSVVQVANQMTANYPNEASNWSNAGFVYDNLIGVAQGADQAAVLAYQESLKRAPQDPVGHIYLGSIYLKRADLNSTALVNARRNGQKIKDEKKVVETIQEDYKKAEESYKKAVGLKKDLASALYNLGVVYEREGQLKNAIKQLELTRLLDQNNPGLAFELGLLYYRDGQKDHALAEMARAVYLSNAYANARWYLALFLEERGEIDLAVAQLKEILKVDVNKDNQIVLEKLAALQAGKREFPPGKVTNKSPLEEPIKKTR